MLPGKVCEFLLFSGLALGFAVTAAAAPLFTRGPFIQNATTNSVTFLWRTAEPADTAVEVGLTEELGELLIDESWETEHWMGVIGFQPDTTYYYRVSSMNDGGLVYSDLFSFTTLRSAGSASFIVVGDSGSANAAEAQVVNVMRNLPADLAIHLGDIVLSGSTDAAFDTYFFNYYTPLLQRIPCYLAIGNHDFGTYGDSYHWENAFDLPRNSAEDTQLYYSFDHGDVHFVVMNVQWNVNPVFDAGSIQFRWLTNDLAVSSKPWKLLFTHAPPLTCGNYAGYVGPLLDLVLPVAERHGVQAIFSSHDHNYQRFAPLNGVHFIVSGGGGRPLYGFRSAHPSLARYDPVYHCLLVGITNETLTVTALDATGAVFDSMTIRKTLPPAHVHQAHWHRPVIETGPSNDGDGNFHGQHFDFLGTPIPTRAGQLSNLGQVFVNNDQTNLYVGFADVMLRSGHNLSLFIQSPRQLGVSSMAGLGNGIVDAPGQAEGLDCLENLTFHNFTPSLACLLGDEFADRQDRSFARFDLALPVGQGAFRLGSGLPDVPGTRLQQYSRSPQALPLNSGLETEQNADFIEISIPLRELGGVQPGDTIKLGAVAAGTQFDTLAQTRELDSSALGYSLSSAGLGLACLEGLAVRLASNPSAPPSVSIAALGTNHFHLSWTSIPNRRYDIESTSNWTSFVRLRDPLLPLAAHGTTSSFVVTSAAPFTAYRVVLLP